MLVISRKKSEQIVVNENIVIEVVEVRGNTVRLGVSAPRDIPVVRAELHHSPATVEAIDGVGALLGHMGNT